MQRTPWAWSREQRVPSLRIAAHEEAAGRCARGAGEFLTSLWWLLIGGDDVNTGTRFIHPNCSFLIGAVHRDSGDRIQHSCRESSRWFLKPNQRSWTNRPSVRLNKNMIGDHFCDGDSWERITLRNNKRKQEVKCRIFLAAESKKGEGSDEMSFILFIINYFFYCCGYNRLNQTNNYSDDNICLLLDWTSATKSRNQMKRMNLMCMFFI